MCGIGVIVQRSEDSAEHDANIGASLARRGPDLQSHRTTNLTDQITATFVGAVLHLRGDVLQPQPCVDTSGNVLLWNGEVFGGVHVPDSVSDTQCMMNELRECNSPEQLVLLLEKVQGPNSFIFWQPAQNRLWFGRDPFGRRSLLGYGLSSAQVDQLLHPLLQHSNHASSSISSEIPISNGICISSLASFDKPEMDMLQYINSIRAEQPHWMELPPVGVFSMQFSVDSASYRMELHPWSNSFFKLPSYLSSQFRPMTPFECSDDASDDDQDDNQSTQEESTDTVVHDSVPAFQHFLHRCTWLLNNFASSFHEVPPQWMTPMLSDPSLFPATCSSQPDLSQVFKLPRSILACWTQDTAVDALILTLGDAVRRRVCLPTKHSNDASVGVLFSGGIDCAVLACLAAKFVPSAPIDLINVAFGPDRETVQASSSSWSSFFDVPDRLAAGNALCELQAVCADSPFRLIEVNVTLQALQREQQRILQLVHPNHTVMDFNIGSILWFGSQAQGYVRPARPFCASKQLRYGPSPSEDSCPLPLSPAQLAEQRREAARLKRLQDFESRKLENEMKYGAARLAARSKVAAESDLATDFTETSIELINHSATVSDAKTSTAPVESKRGMRRAARVEAANQRAGAAQAKSTVASAEENIAVEDEVATVRSACSVLLVGLGADEQMGGYGRHGVVYRTRLRQSDLPQAEVALRAEMLHDTARLWRRNLGRDDRCISDHGREARHPYLDEQVVALLGALPLHFICDLSRPVGMCGDKRILRLAAERLGLTKTATLQKRAMQFGARIANKDVCGTVRLEPSFSLSEVVHPRAVRPLDATPGGRSKIADHISKKTIKQQ